MSLKTCPEIFFKSISHAQHTIFISTGCPFHTLLLTGCDIFKYTSLYYFLWLQRSIGQPKCDFYKFQKIIIKKRITKKSFHNA